MMDGRLQPGPNLYVILYKPLAIKLAGTIVKVLD